MNNEKMREAFEERHLGYVFPSEGLRGGALSEFAAGWQAALSRPAPQGVAELMEKVALYGVFCGYGQDDLADPQWSLIKKTITAIIIERNALCERVAELERDAANKK